MKIKLQNISFSYSQKPLLRNINLEINTGDHIWIKGRSGSGKSSLLRILAGLLKPISGTLQINENTINEFSSEELSEFRFKYISYIHQENHLIPHWNIEQNLSLSFNKKKYSNIIQLFETFYLKQDLLKQKTLNLSGGEKQKISLIRLLLEKKPIVLLDEPTSHLDDESTNQILNYLKVQLQNSTLVIVSHDSRLENLNFKKINFF